MRQLSMQKPGGAKEMWQEASLPRHVKLALMLWPPTSCGTSPAIVMSLAACAANGPPSVPSGASDQTPPATESQVTSSFVRTSGGAVAATGRSNLGAVGASDASRRLNPVTTADGKFR